MAIFNIFIYALNFRHSISTSKKKMKPPRTAYILSSLKKENRRPSLVVLHIQSFIPTDEVSAALSRERNEFISEIKSIRTKHVWCLPLLMLTSQWLDQYALPLFLTLSSIEINYRSEATCRVLTPILQFRQGAVQDWKGDRKCMLSYKCLFVIYVYISIKCLFE